MFREFLSASAIALSVSAAASAAEPSPPLGDTVVTATRTDTEIDAVLAPIIVITRDDLERSLAPDVASLLQFHAGIDVGRNGGPGQPTSVFIRGTDSNHTTVLVDGVRINPGTIGGAPFQNIAPEAIERIEVVKGPRSTLYGTDAIGGVINVITRRHRGNEIDATVGYGRYDTRQASVGGGFGNEDADLSFSAVWLDSAGFPARTETDTDRGYENKTATVSGRANVGAVDLGARLWYASGTSEYSDFFLTPVDQDFTDGMGAVDVGFRPTANWHSVVTLSRMEDEILQNQSSDHVRTRRNALDWQNDVSVGEHQLYTAGALLSRENAETFEFGSGFDVDTAVNMFFLQDQLSFRHQNLLLAAAYTDHETFGSKVTWNFEYGLDLGAHTRLIASAGTGFRAPDSTDRFGFGGNPDLAPESSQNYELALQYRLDRQRFRVSAFHNQIDDLIQFVITNPITFEGQNENVERARIEGVELEYEYRGDSWRLNAEAIKQNPRNLTTDSLLLRRAEESLSMTVGKLLGASEIGLDLLVTGDREDFGVPDPVKLDGYTLVNLYARLQLSATWSIQARLENALDEDYVLARTYNTPGRSLFVATRFEFR